MLACPLCNISGAIFFVDHATSRGYVHCRECDIRFLRPSDRLSLAEEQAHYNHHNNNVDDARYQSFVSPVCDEVKKRISLGGEGLDFGSGSGPVVAKILRGIGYPVELYDPIFLPDRRALERSYDFVVTTEVAEHFFEPMVEFRRLFGLLKLGGSLIVMTLLVSDDTGFENWHYRVDPTHVVFYSDRTFKWILNEIGFSRLEIVSPRVVVLTK